MSLAPSGPTKSSRVVPFPTGYPTREVARLLELSEHRIRAYVKAGFVTPERGPRGEYRFSFQDLVLLRTAKELLAIRSPKKVKRALATLRHQLPQGKDLSSLRITTEGDDIVARDDDSSWIPKSGQTLINFETSELAAVVAPLARQAADDAREIEEDLTAEDWYDLGCELESVDHDQARDAYRRSLELHPEHPDAHINLGRILHEAGHVTAAERHYRVALTNRPRDAIAWFNLGVALQDIGEVDDAIDAYVHAIDADASLADAHYNVSALYERVGKKTLALRHLHRYRDLMREPGH